MKTALTLILSLFSALSYGNDSKICGDFLRAPKIDTQLIRHFERPNHPNKEILALVTFNPDMKLEDLDSATRKIVQSYWKSGQDHPLPSNMALAPLAFALHNERNLPGPQTSALPFDRYMAHLAERFPHFYPLNFGQMMQPDSLAHFYHLNDILYAFIKRHPEMILSVENFSGYHKSIRFLKKLEREQASKSQMTLVLSWEDFELPIRLVIYGTSAEVFGNQEAEALEVALVKEGIGNFDSHSSDNQITLSLDRKSVV